MSSIKVLLDSLGEAKRGFVTIANLAPMSEYEFKLRLYDPPNLARGDAITHLV